MSKKKKNVFSEKSKTIYILFYNSEVKNGINVQKREEHIMETVYD